MTLSVTLERFFAIVYPLRRLGLKNILITISTLIACIYNIPRFYELETVSVADKTNNTTVSTDAFIHNRHYGYHSFQQIHLALFSDVSICGHWVTHEYYLHPGLRGMDEIRLCGDDSVRGHNCLKFTNNIKVRYYFIFSFFPEHWEVWRSGIFLHPNKWVGSKEENLI